MFKQHLKEWTACALVSDHGAGHYSGFLNSLPSCKKKFFRFCSELSNYQVSSVTRGEARQLFFPTLSILSCILHCANTTSATVPGQRQSIDAIFDPFLFLLDTTFKCTFSPK